MRKRILGASVGNCVHVAGVQNFLSLAMREGYETEFLGPAVPLKDLVDAVRSTRPDIVAIGYRLTPSVAESIFRDLRRYIEREGLTQTFIFGGTPSTARAAERSGVFTRVFSGDTPVEDILDFLRGEKSGPARKAYPETLPERVRASYPYPLLRHHFGRPSLQETIDGAAKISRAGLLDILSIGTDQNAQEFFFRQDEMRDDLTGGGGVPVRSEDDLRRIFEATRCGNHPLVRCYSGTQDLIRWAEMLVRTVRNAWGATPLTWYSELDGRSRRGLEQAIKENREVIRWYAERGLPVEVNEAHQWGLRNAHDVIYAAAGYIAGHNALHLGVRHYVMQFMFNTPPGTSPRMDIAKMLAFHDMLVEESARLPERVEIYRMVRPGIASMPSDPDTAKGHMASSISYAMMLHPHIVHVVGYSEADHAIFPEEIIESCRIAHGAIRNALLGTPDPREDGAVSSRIEHLRREVQVILKALRAEGGSPGVECALCDPGVLARAVRNGILDAPHLTGYDVGMGKVVTRAVEGGYEAIDLETGEPLTERERLRSLGLEHLL